MDAAESEKEAAGEALRARIDAYARAERAAMDAAEAEKQAAGEALRARIDAYARAERAAMDAAEAKKQAAGDALRARVDAIARAERAEADSVAFRDKLNQDLATKDIEAMGERARAHARAEAVASAAARDTAEAEGLAMRARIEGYARAERAAEQAAAAQKAADGEALRSRIDSIARAERAQEAADRSASQSAGDAKRARIDAYARADREIEQLRAGIDRTTAALEKEAAAEAWVTRQTVQLSAVLEGLAEDERTAATATVTHTAAMNAGRGQSNGFATAADKAAQASKRFGYSILNVAHAAQDAQYGVGALLNNIPLVVQAFGGGAGLAGGILIAAVALDTLSRNSSLFSDLFVDDFKAAMDQQNAFGDSADRLKEKLKELESKEYKTRIDYQDIDIARKKLDALTEAESSYQRLKTGKSKAAQEAGKLASEAIVEHGGGDDFETSVARVTRAAQAATAAPKSDAEKALEKTIAEETASLRKAENEGGDPEVMAAQRAFIAQKQQELESSFAGARRQQQMAIETMVGRAGAGYGGDIKSLIGIMQASPGAFKAQGVGPGLLPGLLKATPERVEERKAQENIAKIEADRKKQADKLARDEAENIRHEQQMKEQAAREAAKQQAAREQAGVDQIRIDQKLKSEAEAARKKAVAKVDQAFTPGAMAELARNRLNIVASQADQAAGGLGLPVARNDRDVNQFRRMGQPFVAPEAALARELQGRVARDLRAGGKDPSLATDIVRDAIEKLDTKLTETLARTPTPDTAMAGFGAQANQTLARTTQMQSALADVVANLSAGQIRIGQQQAAVWNKLSGVMQQQQRPAVRRPTRARN
jgi:hypothetical protein